MRVQLNGEPRELQSPMSIAALLEHLKVNPQLVAVEYNLRVIRRAQYAETMIEEGAEIEIVAFVGGGCGTVSAPRPPRRESRRVRPRPRVPARDRRRRGR